MRGGPVLALAAEIESRARSLSGKARLPSATRSGPLWQDLHLRRRLLGRHIRARCRWAGHVRRRRRLWRVRWRRGCDVGHVVDRARRRVRSDVEREVEADAVAGCEARDQEAAQAAEAKQPVVGAQERHPTRDVVADPDIAGGETATVADADRVADAAAGTHRLAVSLLDDRHVATRWAGSVRGHGLDVVEQVATTGNGRSGRAGGAELQAVSGR